MSAFTSIAYMEVAHPAGHVVIGATKDAVCFLAVNTSPQTILNYYPEAELSPEANVVLKDAARQLESWPVKDADIALEVSGTPMQQAVWKALRRIPLGATCTYTDIARMIGKPEAVRAVANACGANPVSLLIPCHRVLRTDGSLGGYAWGLDVKQRLLAIEASINAERVQPASKLVA